MRDTASQTPTPETLELDALVARTRLRGARPAKRLGSCMTPRWRRARPKG